VRTLPPAAFLSNPGAATVIESRSVFISVAEDSADIHGASLARRAASRLPGWRLHGMAGPRMAAAGVEPIYDFTAHAAMLTGIFSIIGHARHALRLIESSWQKRRPDVVVLLDSPELHLPLARRAAALALPVLYYIAPQTWASREGRTRMMRNCIDRLACILPFEEEYFRARGVNAEFVGHPLFESEAPESAAPNAPPPFSADAQPRIALLPGSRRHVIDAVLPLQLEVLRQARPALPDAQVTVSAATPARRAQIEAILRQRRESQVGVTLDNARLLRDADLVLVASGTATLNVARYRKPMIVVYDAGALLGALHRRLGRYVVRTPHLSLVNILARARVVPEFMPTVPEPRRVAEVLIRLWRDAFWRSQMAREIDRVIRPLESPGASERVCALIEELAVR